MIKDKKIIKLIIFININLEYLQEVFKIILKNIKRINLKKDKLFI